MQPLIILLLVALLVALLAIRETLRKLNLSEHWKAYFTDSAEHWSHRCIEHQIKADDAECRANKLSLDNVFLRAELKRKHRRVPKL